MAGSSRISAVYIHWIFYTILLKAEIQSHSGVITSAFRALSTEILPTEIISRRHFHRPPERLKSWRVIKDDIYLHSFLNVINSFDRSPSPSPGPKLVFLFHNWCLVLAHNDSILYFLPSIVASLLIPT